MFRRLQLLLALVLAGASAYGYTPAQTIMSTTTTARPSRGGLRKGAPPAPADRLLLQTKPIRGGLRQQLLRRTPVVPEQQNAIGEPIEQQVLTPPGAKPIRGRLRQTISPALKDRTSLGTLVVPNMGIGTIAWTAQDDEDRLRIDTIAQCARENGLDFFDTAERYGAKPASMIPAALAGVGVPIDSSYLGGDCESNLARWGTGSTVATKFTPTPWRRSAQDVVKAAEQSAARLGVQQLDLYQIHMPDIIQPFARFGAADIKDEIYWDGLAECYKRGLVKNVGVSNYGPTLLRRAQEHLARQGVPLASNQIAFNLLTRRQGSQATVDAGLEIGVKTMAYYPLAMGLLTGKLSPQRLQSKNDLRSRDLLRYLQGGSGGTAGLIPKGGISPLLAVLEEVARGRDKSMAQIALNWIVSKGAIPIPGASSVEQVQDNIGALGWRLSKSEMEQLEEAADKLSFDFSGASFQTTDSKFVGYGFEKWRLD